MEFLQKRWKILLYIVLAIFSVFLVRSLFTMLQALGWITEGSAWKHFLLVAFVVGLLWAAKKNQLWGMRKLIVIEVFVLILVMEAYYVIYAVVGKTYDHDTHRMVAYSNTRKLIAMETMCGMTQLELLIQRLFVDVINSQLLMHCINLFYMAAHIPCTLMFVLHAFMGCLVKRDTGLKLKPSEYVRLRNAFAISHVFVCLTSWLIPLAPPRMFNSIGYVDTIVKFTNIQLGVAEERLGVNPYAAMPSLHFAYAGLVGFGYAAFGTKKWIRMSGVGYAALVLFGIVVTGNHFFMDAIVSVGYNWLGWMIAPHFPDWQRKHLPNDPPPEGQPEEEELDRLLPDSAGKRTLEEVVVTRGREE